MTALQTFTDPDTGAQLIQYEDGSWVFVGEIRNEFGVWTINSLLPDHRPDLEAIAARQVSDALAVAAAGADRARAGGA